MGYFFPAALSHPLARIALLFGLAVRITWGVRRRIFSATGEAQHVAVAWAQGHGFADAFMPGQGPTAHLLPVSPLIGGLIYRLFGIESVTSEVILFVIAQIAIVGSFVLFAKCFERLGSPPRAILIGFSLLCALPLYTTVEAFDFRVWEGAHGLFFGALSLLAILSVDQGEPPRFPILWLGALPAVTFFINPAVGVSAFGALALLLWRHRTGHKPAWIVASSALTLLLLIGPWTARNIVVMQHPIILRDNLGLELAVGNFPEALSTDDFDATFENHLQSMHPRDHPVPYQAMQRAGGEVAYARLMGAQARRWIVDHPFEAAQLWLRHVREMLFTRTWMFETARGRWLPVIRSTALTIIGLIGLVGLAGRLRRDPTSWYAASFIALPVLCYIPFQPIMRYTWLLYPVLMYFATDLLARLHPSRHLT